MNAREQIIKLFMNAGYDVFTSCEQADATIAEFKVEGKSAKRFGIMGAHGKCVDAFELRHDPERWDGQS